METHKTDKRFLLAKMHAQRQTETTESDCMRCETTFITATASPSDYCPKCSYNPNRLDI